MNVLLNKLENFNSIKIPINSILKINKDKYLHMKFKIGGFAKSLWNPTKFNSILRL